ncbi:hypothetical protein HD806DRAFT_505308 [Xylariaceae sp. AK1471]|nr:hypothetical protein HD806DRAFT_505308 [Xylariaceae sp. AK1471]
MLRSLLGSAAIYGGLASATTITFGSVTTGSSCSYLFGTGGVPLTPVPTQDIHTTLTIRETKDTATVPSTITVNAPTDVTVTEYTTTTTTWTEHTTTLSTFTQGAPLWKTIATATFAATVCANGAKPSTVTKYTGTYKPISGQSTTVPATYPTAAFCTTATSYVNILYPTVTSGSVTTTVTPTITVTSPTTTATTTIDFGTYTITLSTVTTTFTTNIPASITTTKTVSCPNETVTKTLDARCAPTNLIGDINGEGLLSGEYADRTVVAYTRNDPWASDFSACCQACLDSPGCGASMSGGGACGLLYTASAEGEPVCNAFIYSFTAWPDVLPGQGLVNANGCDFVEFQGKNAKRSIHN